MVGLRRLRLLDPPYKTRSTAMTQIDLTGRAAVVTGSARGIGHAIAERLLASGARVSLWDRDTSALDAAARGLGERGEAHAATVDVTDDASIAAAVRATVGRFGGIDILVNNAGIAGGSKPSWEFTPAEWREVIEIDLTGVFLCCRAVVPTMRPRGWGRIVNVASIAGKEGNPNAAHYSAAKAGVIGFTKALGKELATSGILVNCITPAVIETDILKQITPQHVEYMRSKIPMGRFGKTEEAAALVAWLCSAECSFTTGGVFDLSGGRATY
jgi:NAD(P)-dependent dehydrogenase (short-subunit alcohol dehydrogenase family)